jgi:hypothetical protein
MMENVLILVRIVKPRSISKRTTIKTTKFSGLISTKGRDNQIKNSLS